MKYVCNVCGYIYDEENNKKLFEDLPENWVCEICESGKMYFSEVKEDKSNKDKKDTGIISSKSLETERDVNTSLSYSETFYRNEDSIEESMNIIHEMAMTGKSVIEPMRSSHNIPSWKDILIIGAQLSKAALDEDEVVNTTTVIGKHARQPLVIESPVFITHMSFGALSKELKISLARGSAAAKTAMCSGEGGILEASIEASYKYIFEYVPNMYSVSDDNLKRVDAIEIKIGQGTKPGMGGHLPGEKVTEEIAKVRNKPVNIDIISPSRFKDINSKEDIKALVDELRRRSDGRPIGIKIAAGHIEKDLEIIAFSGADFVTIDGRGGGTGASPKMIKDATTVPTIFALYRARKYIDDNQLELDLIITGGLRLSSDFAKAIALGADAIAIGTAAMMAAACQQYKVCHLGKCPVGCATQDETLRKRLDIDHSAKRLYNYMTVVLEEIKTFGRITGNRDIHNLCVTDLCTIDHNISMYTDIKHV